MFSNVYEDPHFTTNVRYSKEVDGGERVERTVAIYERRDTSEEPDVAPWMQDGGAHAHKRPQDVLRNPFRPATLLLGLLCLILLVALTVLSKLHVSVTSEKHQLTQDHNTSYEEMQTSYENLRNSLCQFPDKADQTQGSKKGWTRFKCSCYYKSTDVKNWTDSRMDCQKIGADLVTITSQEEQEFVRKLNEGGSSWIGLRSTKIQNLGEQSRWIWVDKSPAHHTAWQKEVNVEAVYGSRGYIDLQGLWKHTKEAQTLKHWICERPIQE